MSSARRFEPARSDFYFRVPYRVHAALRARELRAREFLVLTFLIGEVERVRFGSRVEFKLDDLARGLDWESSPDWLRKTLHGLHDAGWLEVSVPKPGSRGAYVVKLQAAAVDGAPESDDDVPETGAPVPTAEAGTARNPSRPSRGLLGGLQQCASHSPERRRDRLPGHAQNDLRLRAARGR